VDNLEFACLKNFPRSSEVINWLIKFIDCINLHEKIKILQLYEIMPTTGRRRIGYMQVSITTRPYNNNIKIIYDILKALPITKYVSLNWFEIMFKKYLVTSIVLILTKTSWCSSQSTCRRDDKTWLGRLKGFMRIDDDAREETGLMNSEIVCMI